MADFFDMGGYAGYVWPAYGVSAVALLSLGLYIAGRSRSARKRLQDAEQRAAPASNSDKTAPGGEAS